MRHKIAGLLLLTLAALEAVVVAALLWAQLPGARLFTPEGILALLVGLAVSAAFFMILVRIGMRLLRPEPMPAVVEQRSGVPPPIPPVGEEAIESLPEPIRACPDCAYVGVRMPQLGDGLWPGGGELGDRVVCPRCGFQGIAVRFEKREDYGAFLRDLART